MLNPLPTAATSAPDVLDDAMRALIDADPRPIPPPGPPRDDPFPLLDRLHRCLSRLDRATGEVLIVAHGRRRLADGDSPARVRIRPLDPGRGVTAAIQDEELATVERLLLQHLHHCRTRLKPSLPAPSALPPAERIRRQAEAVMEDLRLAPAWSLDHRVLRNHHSPYARHGTLPDGSRGWSPVPQAFDAASIRGWSPVPQAFDAVTSPHWHRVPFPIPQEPWRRPPLAKFRSPPPVPGPAPRTSAYAVTIGFYLTGYIPGSLFNIARLVACKQPALLVQIDGSQAWRAFEWRRDDRCWAPGLPAAWPRGPVRFTLPGHPWGALSFNQRWLSGMAPEQLADRLHAWATEVNALLPAPELLRPSRISLMSCWLESPLTPFSYGAALLQAAAARFGTAELTVTVRSRNVHMEFRPEGCHCPRGGWHKALANRAPVGTDFKDFTSTWARIVPAATWILRLGPDGQVQKADKYAQGGRAWITDARLSEPLPARPLIAWLGERPADRPGRSSALAWSSEGSHVMLGEVWIGLDVLQQMGARLDGCVPARTETLDVPGAYARLRFDAVQLLAFMRSWPDAEALLAALRLLRQALRDEVPPLVDLERDASLRRLAADAVARQLLRVVQLSVADDLTVDEAVWRHVQ